MEIRSLADISFDELFEVFSQAFADYELQINKEEHLAMLKRRGFDSGLSFAAFDGSKMVSFTCNGIGEFYGVSTAYDTGTGTLKEYRGQGLATKVFEYSIPYLKKAGINEYLLEVLQHNRNAVSVYRKIGFEISREFYYFKQENKLINNTVKCIEFPHTVRVINSNEFKSLTDFWDFRPSWQNSFESIKRAQEEMICLGVCTENKLLGYCVFEPSSGDVTQIAVDKEHRRKGIGSLLFEKMLEHNKCNSLKVINTDINCHSITHFLQSKNILPTGKQFEMIKKL